MKVVVTRYFCALQLSSDNHHEVEDTGKERKSRTRHVPQIPYISRLGAVDCSFISATNFHLDITAQSLIFPVLLAFFLSFSHGYQESLSR